MMTKGNQTKRIHSRDWEALSAYLDGQLGSYDRARLEKHLQARPDLRTALDELRRTRSVLRSQPRLRAPRNFTLTPEMVRARKTKWGFPLLFPALGMASALASAFFIVVLLFDLLGGGAAGAPSMVAMQVTQEAALRSYASTEAPAADVRPGQTAEGLPKSPEALPQAQEQAEAPAATEEAAMALEAAPSTQSSEQPYPLFTEAPANALAATDVEGTPAIPTPAPMLSDTVPDQQEAFTQKSSPPAPYPPPGGLAEESEDLEQAAPVQPGFWTPLRLLEVGLALIALAAGAAALLVRRIVSS